MPVASQRSRDIGRPLTRSSLAVISEITRPAPSAAVKRRNGASVTPDIGARRTGLAISILPILKGLGFLRSEPVTGFSFAWQLPHCRRPNRFEAQILCSQVRCLHFRQFS